MPKIHGLHRPPLTTRHKLGLSTQHYLLGGPRNAPPQTVPLLKTVSGSRVKNFSAIAEEFPPACAGGRFFISISRTDGRSHRRDQLPARACFQHRRSPSENILFRDTGNDSELPVPRTSIARASDPASLGHSDQSAVCECVDSHARNDRDRRGGFMARSHYVFLLTGMIWRDATKGRL